MRKRIRPCNFTRSGRLETERFSSELVHLKILSQKRELLRFPGFAHNRAKKMGSHLVPRLLDRIGDLAGNFVHGNDDGIFFRTSV